MGLYKCIADNGIPPTANQTYQLEVYCKLIYKSCKHFYILGIVFVNIEFKRGMTHDMIKRGSLSTGWIMNLSMNTGWFF